MRGQTFAVISKHVSHKPPNTMHQAAMLQTCHCEGCAPLWLMPTRSSPFLMAFCDVQQVLPPPGARSTTMFVAISVLYQFIKACMIMKSLMTSLARQCPLGLLVGWEQSACTAKLDGLLHSYAVSYSTKSNPNVNFQTKGSQLQDTSEQEAQQHACVTPLT